VCVVMLSAVILSVIMLNVVAPEDLLSTTSNCNHRLSAKNKKMDNLKSMFKNIFYSSLVLRQNKLECLSLARFFNETPILGVSLVSILLRVT
jgi:hypothetical protein